VRKAAGTAVRAAKPRGLRSVTIVFPEDHALSDDHLEELPCLLTARVIVEGMALGEKDWDTYKSDRKDQSVPTGVLVVNDAGNSLDGSSRQEIQAGVEEGRILAEAQ